MEIRLFIRTLYGILVTASLVSTGWSGWLGMAIRPPAGAEVEEVMANGPAAHAGLLVGDRVLAVNGLEIQSVAQLTGIIANLPVGEPAILKIWRNGMTVDVQALPQPAPRQAGESGNKHMPRGAAWLGIVTGADPQGLRIREVALDSPAHRAGLHRNDILVRVNGTNPTTPEMLTRLISRQYPGTPVDLEIVRDGTPMSLKVDLVVRPEGR
ncbi:MAG: PDZ domain-containing protein [Magnetococcales bacterium]|nr:PDZ domain-containing protein [Magnetococcales bacterium]NGZ29162.1 PDZ domain-containing protein [Magnetococcales bacterium]